MKDRKTFYLNYDLDATTFKYGKVTDRLQGFGGLTAVASVTINATNAGAAPFAPVLVGDYIQFQIGEAWSTIRKVLTKPSNDQITVSGGVLTFAGLTNWYFFPFRIGATAADGGHSTEAYSRAWIEFEIPTISAAGGVDYSIEVKGRAPAAAWGVVATGTFPDAASVVAQGPLELTELIGSVRVGIKGNTGFAGTDDISIFLTGNPGAQVW